MRRAVVASLVTLALVGASGCELLLGIGDTEVSSPQAPDAAADANPGNQACELAQPPAPPEAIPSSKDPGRADGETASTLVVNVIDLGEGQRDDGLPRYKAIGFDLDGHCGGAGQPRTCASASWVEPGDADGINGIDNATGAIIADQTNLFGQAIASSDAINKGMRESGDAPMFMIRVSDYTGGIVDDRVTVEWFRPVLLDTTNGKKAPTWDGSDAWIVSDEGVVTKASAPGGFEGIKVTDAYVNQYVLVARFPDDVPLNLFRHPIKASTTILTGTLKPLYPSPTWAIVDGMIATYLKISELFVLLPSWATSFTGTPFCTDAASYGIVKKLICKFSDSLVSGGVNPEKDCDAVSFGFRFTAIPSAVSAAQSFPHKRLCPADTDPAKDNCTSPPK